MIKKHNVNEQLSEQNNRLIILFHNDYVGNENTLFSFFKRKRRYSSSNESTAVFYVCDFYIEQWKHISPEIRQFFCR